ncbi:MAG: glucose-6-phosphate dehydrogenase assembly protein OpcA [Planctomycetota bacterium]
MNAEPATSAMSREMFHSDGNNGGSQPCLSNLVIYTEEAADEQLIRDTITQYILKHPCRVIVIFSLPRSAISRLDGSFSAHTFNDSTGKSVACDQFTLHVSGSAVKELASAIQPLLVADLPINVWWRGNFLSQRIIVEQMLAFADRFIYDGVNWTNLHFTVMQVDDFFTRHEEKVAFTNFNWARLRPWRECAADFFDAGMFENEIWELNTVRIEYMSMPGMEEGYQFRALLLLSWLAVQLEWVPETGTPGMDDVRLEFKDKRGENVNAELVMLPQSTPTSQGLQRVVMSIHTADRFHAFIVERDHHDRLMILRHDDTHTQRVLRTFPHADSKPSDLLLRELGRRQRSRVFEKSFKLASNLLQMI